MDSRPNVFASEYAEVFDTYSVELQIRDQIMGGVPKNPKLMQGWIRAKAGVQDQEEIRRMMVRTLQELGVEVSDETPYEDLVAASEKVASAKSGNGFKTARDGGGIYVESRHVKACLREAVNIIFAGERRGTTKKGVRSYYAERTFVDPDVILLGKAEADGSKLFIGHTSGPQGPQSNLTMYEFATRPLVAFTVIAMKGTIPDADWPKAWITAGEIGLGALRSQGAGRFDVVRWDKVKTDAGKLAEARRKAALYRSQEENESSDTDLLAAVRAAGHAFESNGHQPAPIGEPILTEVR